MGALISAYLDRSTGASNPSNRPFFMTVLRSHRSRRSSNASDGSSTVSSATSGRVSRYSYIFEYSIAATEGRVSEYGEEATIVRTAMAGVLVRRENDELRKAQTNACRVVVEWVKGHVANEMVGVHSGALAALFESEGRHPASAAG